MQRGKDEGRGEHPGPPCGAAPVLHHEIAPENQFLHESGRKGVESEERRHLALLRHQAEPVFAPRLGQQQQDRPGCGQRHRHRRRPRGAGEGIRAGGAPAGGLEIRPPPPRHRAGGREHHEENKRVVLPHGPPIADRPEAGKRGADT